MQEQRLQSGMNMCFDAVQPWFIAGGIVVNHSAVQKALKQ